MKSAIVLGSNSDIMKAITPMMEFDGWTVHGWNRARLKGMSQEDYYSTYGVPMHNWDLCIIAIGRVAPVGLFTDNEFTEWQACLWSNLTLPALLLKKLLAIRNPGASVIWFAGSNPQTIMDGYSAYNTSKMAVLKLVEQLDHEMPDCKFVALGPGVCATKIHSETVLTGWDNPRLARALKDGSFTKMEDVYATLKWCVEQPKEVVGGRNVCVSDLGRGLDGRLIGDSLAVHMRQRNNLFKLRRDEDEGPGPLG